MQIYLTDNREYDPWGRLGWWQPDPKSEYGGQESLTPYHYAFDNPILHNDPKGDCVPGTNCAALIAAASADAAVNPNGVGAHAIGITEGLVNSVEGMVNAVTHPLQTLQGLGNLAVAAFAGNPVDAAQMDHELGTNSVGAMQGFTNAVSTGTNNLINGNGIQRGQVVGQVAGAILGSKGLGAIGSTLRGAATAEGFLFGSVSIKTPFSIPVQRFGAMSVGGTSAFGLRTGSSQILARTFNAILPKWNNLSNYTIGTIPRGTTIRLGITAPQGLRFLGGLPQINVQPRLVVNQGTKLVN